MLLAYFDEVKHQKNRPFYWLGAVLADATLIWELESELNVLAVDVFGSAALTKDTEFHAADMYNGHQQFEEWSSEKRIETFCRLITIFGQATGLAKIYVKIDVLKFPQNQGIEERAFMFLVERIEMHLKSERSPGMLIGDRENETIAGKFAQQFSIYRTDGTDWAFGRAIENLIDTVHFTHSHHSRMLQLADLHVYLRQFLAVGAYGNPVRARIIDHVRSIPDCLSPRRYKIWPPER